MSRLHRLVRLRLRGASQSAVDGGLEHYHRQTVSAFDDYGVGLFEAKECFN